MKLSRGARILQTLLAFYPTNALALTCMKPAQERAAHLVLDLRDIFSTCFLSFLFKYTPMWLFSEVPDKGLVNKYLKSTKSA